MRRAEHRSRARERGVGRVEQLREAEIAHERVTAFVEKNVRWFQIAMQHGVRVRVLHGIRDARDQLRDLPPFSRVIAEPSRERAAHRELHREKRDAILLAKREHRQDRRVFQIGHRLRLLPKPHERRR